MAEEEALVPSLSVDAMVQKRTDIKERLAKSKALMDEAIQLAMAIGPRVDAPLHLIPETGGGRHGHRRRFEVDSIMEDVDARIWDLLMAHSGMVSLMDAEARNAWQKSLDSRELPEITAANVEATFQHLATQRGDFFERGVINLFKTLGCYDYKTNNACKLGKRIILRHVVESNWNGGRRTNYGGNANALDDILRVFAVLEGHPEPDHKHNARAQLDAQFKDKPNEPAVVGVLSGGESKLMFEVRGFKNGNGHVTFRRPDLVDKLNKIIAKHYPNALPPRENGDD